MSDSPKKQIRVRFAPSPTGPFSIGNARTALYNWLFARGRGGEFLLRIEDTDKTRSKKKYEKGIVSGLRWLGLEWDGEIVYQSQRGKIYAQYLNRLLDAGLVYYCFCTPEELEMERQAQLSQGLAPRYSGRCRSITIDEAKKMLKTKPAVLRFKMPEREVSFLDLVRGRVKFNTALIGDIVIAKSLMEPLYNFAAVVDDYEMKITHVIRGEDHLANTPKQILLQEALGFESPVYAHLPLILGPDRKKLSKRYLDKSLEDYQKNGYLPEAMLNFLVLLGWHPQSDREVLSLKEMIQEFSLERVQKAGAVFNEDKLDWLNAYYIKNMNPADLLKRLKKFIPADWFSNLNLLKKIVVVEQERLKRLDEFVSLVDFFFKLPDYDKNLLIWGKTDANLILDNLKRVQEAIKEIPDNRFSKTNIELKIMPIAEQLGRGEVLWPLRVALSGRAASPGPFEIIDILGKKESLKRISLAIKKLETFL